MNLLVTGGAGFIGSNFIHHILDKHDDWRIINLDNLSYGSNLMSLKDLEVDKRYGFVKGSINDIKVVSKLIKNVDAVVNFAAMTHVDRSISNPYPFIESNILGTYTILEACRKFNREVNLVHISTDEVYSDIAEGSYTEEDRLMPSSPYSASKASSDMLVLGYARTYDLNAKITRCTNNYGPYQFPEKLIPKTIIRANMNLKVPVYGTGKNVRDWLHVLDHCTAIETIIDKGKRREIYNISAYQEKTNIEVVETILDRMGKRQEMIEFVEDRPGHDIRYSIDSSKIRKLGWKPEYEFEDGIKHTIKWYLDNQWWWKSLIDEKILHPTPWKIDWR